MSQADEIRITRVSSVYQTAPWGYADQPDFLNCVVEAQTSLAPGELLRRAQAVEQSMGREPSVRYGPRSIDVDILLYGSSVVDEPGLQIPHPRLHQRAFVLVPLAELCPHLEHPVLEGRHRGVGLRRGRSRRGRVVGTRPYGAG